MVALLIGLVLIAFTVIACLPQTLGWGPHIILFLKGCAPVLAAFIGLIAVFVGIADIKDRNEAKKEEEAAKASEEKPEAKN
ncbi:MAG: hypothetical protein Pg6C_09580 [Treponemataceae bacterium]|nr:MAG: hypothetical protein Pg6C_09580 [Treponemataceae bacterium]